MNTFLIALGANLPFGELSPTSTLQKALASLESPSVAITKVSKFYRTPCFPPGAGPDYVNAAAELRSLLDPYELLAHLHAIETDFGRKRAQRWGMRTLDLDVIAMDDAVLPDKRTFEIWRNLSPDRQRNETPQELILPHPRLQDRAFVLVPLLDIAAEWRHPVANQTVTQMCNALSPDDLAEVHAL